MCIMIPPNEPFVIKVAVAVLAFLTRIEKAVLILTGKSEDQEDKNK